MWLHNYSAVNTLYTVRFREVSGLSSFKNFKNQTAGCIFFGAVFYCKPPCIYGFYGAFSADSSLWLDTPLFWTSWHQSMSTYSQPSLSSSTWKRSRVWMRKLGVIFQERLKIEVTLLLSTNRKSLCRVDWYNNGWHWVTLNGRFTHRALSLRKL